MAAGVLSLLYAALLIVLFALGVGINVFEQMMKR